MLSENYTKSICRNRCISFHNGQKEERKASAGYEVVKVCNQDHATARMLQAYRTQEPQSKARNQSAVSDLQETHAHQGNLDSVRHRRAP